MVRSRWSSTRPKTGSTRRREFSPGALRHDQRGRTLRLTRVPMNIRVPERRPSDQTQDDSVQAFQVDALDVRGRVARLGPVIDELLARHDYPAPVARLVAEAATLAVLLGSTLKDIGRFTLQTQTDGPVDMIVVDIASPDRVRAYARYSEERLAALNGGALKSGALLGHGHLAMTIEPGGEQN